MKRRILPAFSLAAFSMTLLLGVSGCGYKGPLIMPPASATVPAGQTNQPVQVNQPASAASQPVAQTNTKVAP